MQNLGVVVIVGRSEIGHAKHLSAKSSDTLDLRMKNPR